MLFIIESSSLSKAKLEINMPISSLLNYTFYKLHCISIGLITLSVLSTSHRKDWLKIYIILRSWLPKGCWKKVSICDFLEEFDKIYFRLISLCISESRENFCISRGKGNEFDLLKAVRGFDEWVTMMWAWTIRRIFHISQQKSFHYKCKCCYRYFPSLTQLAFAGKWLECYVNRHAIKAFSVSYFLFQLCTAIRHTTKMNPVRTCKLFVLSFYLLLPVGKCWF